MERANEGNLLEIIDLAHSLRQEHLYITSEQQMFLNLNETLNKNASNVAQVSYRNSFTFPNMCSHLSVFVVGLDMRPTASEFEPIDCFTSRHWSGNVLLQSEFARKHQVHWGTQSQGNQVSGVF